MISVLIQKITITVDTLMSNIHIYIFFEYSISSHVHLPGCPIDLILLLSVS
jgi:hypothetical protein